MRCAVGVNHRVGSFLLPPGYRGIKPALVGSALAQAPLREIVLAVLTAAGWPEE